jgi:hypothetical protein
MREPPSNRGQKINLARHGPTRERRHTQRKQEKIAKEISITNTGSMPECERENAKVDVAKVRETHRLRQEEEAMGAA